MLRGRRTCGVPARPSRDRPTRMTLRGATSHEPASESTPLAQADPGQLLQDHRAPEAHTTVHSKAWEGRKCEATPVDVTPTAASSRLRHRGFLHERASSGTAPLRT